MGFTVIDLANEANTLFVNFWNWRPTVELIRSFGIVDSERIELMHMQCVGATVSKLEAYRIAERIETEVLPRLSEDDRVRPDLTVTNEPDDGTFHRDREFGKNYSATAPWLKEFAAFCRDCKGFKVV